MDSFSVLYPKLKCHFQAVSGLILDDRDYLLELDYPPPFPCYILLFINFLLVGMINAE
jgi:hypothetical protein